MKILYIHSTDKDHQFYNNYMNDLLLHGLRDLYGNDIIDYPGCWYLYDDEIKKRKYDEKRFWGKGFTIKNILRDFNSIDRENIEQKIRNKYFDTLVRLYNPERPKVEGLKENAQFFSSKRLLEGGKEYLSYAAVSYVDDHSPAYSIPQQLEVSRSCGQVSLRVAWITPDVTEHPVSRFLYSFLSSSADPNVHSTVVGVSENRPTDDWLLSDFACLDRVDAMNYPAQPLSQCVNAIKSLDFDIAVDLAGWTGGNFQAGFLQRIAPVQINYLGYFASTGNTEMDYWLGDENLFPDPMNEWHSESIHRLSRCFIAWQPTEHFPEGRVSVTDAPRGSIKFGCFNHNRKLSDATLNAWGRILECLPEARLVLKAHSASDPGTQTLLRRRMLRQGLVLDLLRDC